jgi:hypothetical protein
MRPGLWRHQERTSSRGAGAARVAKDARRRSSRMRTLPTRVLSARTGPTSSATEPGSGGGGEIALQALTRRKPNPKNRVAVAIEEAVLAVAIEQPAWGQVRVSNELKEQGRSLPPFGERGVWQPRNLGNRPAEPGPKCAAICAAVRDSPPCRTWLTRVFVEMSSGRPGFPDRGRHTDRPKAEFSAQRAEEIGWGGRIRTSVWRNQNPLPYHLATPHHETCEHRLACHADRRLSPKRTRHAGHSRSPARLVAKSCRDITDADRPVAAPAIGDPKPVQVTGTGFAQRVQITHPDKPLKGFSYAPGPS